VGVAVGDAVRVEVDDDDSVAVPEGVLLMVGVADDTPNVIA
jgi:hypothetical protein